MIFAGAWWGLMLPPSPASDEQPLAGVADVAGVDSDGLVVVAAGGGTGVGMAGMAEAGTGLAA